IPSKTSWPSTTKIYATFTPKTSKTTCSWSGAYFSRNEDDRCYDNVCSEFYDCGRNDCDCSPCGTKTKNNSAGDVHLVTPDGLAFDFQGAGEFLLLKSSDGKIEIQTRQEPWLDSDRVTVNTAVAMNVNGDRVGIYLNKL